jgi:hypothetical protein
MASYVGNRFVEQRKENVLFEGLSCLMGAVIVGLLEHPNVFVQPTWLHTYSGTNPDSNSPTTSNTFMWATPFACSVMVLVMTP